MARMIVELYDALSAGADEDKARAAATAIAGRWDVEPRFHQIDRRFDQIDSRIDDIEQRLDRLEQRVSKLEADVGIIKWMLGFTLAFQSRPCSSSGSLCYDCRLELIVRTAGPVHRSA